MSTTSLMSTSLPALKAYLEGRALDRRAKWNEALTHYRMLTDAQFWDLFEPRG